MLTSVPNLCRPPELLLGEATYGTEVDMWSAGCIIAELLNNKAILTGSNEVDQLEKIWQLCGTPNDSNWPEAKKLPLYYLMPKEKFSRRLRQVFQKKEGRFDAFAIDLIDKLLTLNPKNRPTAHDAMQAEWFKQEPYKATPEEMPTYPSIHEFQAKKLKQQHRDRTRKQREMEERKKLNDKTEFDKTTPLSLETGTIQAKRPKPDVLTDPHYVSREDAPILNHTTVINEANVPTNDQKNKKNDGQFNKGSFLPENNNRSDYIKKDFASNSNEINKRPSYVAVVKSDGPSESTGSGINLNITPFLTKEGAPPPPPPPPPPAQYPPAQYATPQQPPHQYNQHNQYPQHSQHSQRNQYPPRNQNHMYQSWTQDKLATDFRHNEFGNDNNRGRGYDNEYAHHNRTYNERNGPYGGRGFHHRNGPQGGRGYNDWHGTHQNGRGYQNSNTQSYDRDYNHGYTSAYGRGYDSHAQDDGRGYREFRGNSSRGPIRQWNSSASRNRDSNYRSGTYNDGERPPWEDERR